MSLSSRIASVLLYSALLLLTVGLFWPGVSGGFILDDFPNLALLALLPTDGNVIQMLNLASNGISSELGRPLSMLSFLMQAQHWPDDPQHFKWINILIHTANGVLVILLGRALGAAAPAYALRPVFLALLAAIWLWHPIQVSSVLYVVQRMNLLASFFVLSGLLSYLWARRRYAESEQNVFLWLMVLGPLMAFIFGVLSKENAALLYLYLWVLEFTLLAGNESSAALTRARRLAVFVPLSIGLVASLVYLPATLDGYLQKPFTVLERSVSQFPVLLAYLQAILIPQPSEFGLFHDDFQVYASLLSPTALLSFLLIVALVLFALGKRNEYPLPAFAVLWFMAGHAMESSILPLEIYFEHRNYLPLLGIAFSVAYGVQLWHGRLGVTAGKSLAVATAAACLGLATVSTFEASRWGDSLAQARTELERHPESYRAQSHLVQTLTNSGQAEQGYRLHRRLLETGEERIAAYIRWLEFACILPGIDLPSSESLQTAALNSAQDFSVVGQLNNLVPAVINQACPGLPTALLEGLVDGLINNQRFRASQPDLLFAQANLLAGRDELESAIALASRSFSLRPQVSVGLARLNWLIESGDLNGAARFMETFESEFSLELATRAGLAQLVRDLREQLN